MKAPHLGILEWFHVGEYERVERVLEDLRAYGVGDLRTGVSWADWFTDEGQRWYDWLLPRLASEVRVLPCFTYTPPSLGIAPHSSSPPREVKDYADFLDVFVTRLGAHFDWVELWNEPNNVGEWDWRLDPEWTRFAAMIVGAAYWMHQRGKKVALGGMSPLDPNWLDLIGRHGVLQHIDAVGLHGFPGTWETAWAGWSANVDRARQVLERHGVSPELWITEVGYSTWKHDEEKQLATFLDVLEAPAERVYWYAAQDLDPRRPAVDRFHEDEREYHFGLKRADGTPKLLSRLWAAGGLQAIREMAAIADPTVKITGPEPPVLITGGAGFVGTNLASRFMAEGRPVIVYDNLNRPGVERNLKHMHARFGDLLTVRLGDIRDLWGLADAVGRAGLVYHLAAQVAVTTSLVNPQADFEVNARGTLNLLEALRALDTPVPVVFTSTNKVYGGLEDVPLAEGSTRYMPESAELRERGVSEARPLDFHSPYGCSKGTADQYTLDYARSFGIPAAVFRMSCIYGPHQFGTEDQGWVAHFLIAAVEGRPITLYGDGKQVRDVLFVEDLVDAFQAVARNMDLASGQAFNIGGGPASTVSLIELLALIAEIHGATPEVQFDAWRVGDQRYYVSDTTKFRELAGWAPKVGVKEGVTRLYEWLLETRGSSRRLVAGKGTV